MIDNTARIRPSLTRALPNTAPCADCGEIDFTARDSSCAACAPCRSMGDLAFTFPTLPSPARALAVFTPNQFLSVVLCYE